MNDQQNLLRWRLILGRFAEQQLNVPMDNTSKRMEQALDYLYQREYQGRGVRGEQGNRGGLGPSNFNVPRWLNEIQTLFPKETVEQVEQHALERYGLTDLFKNPDTLARLEPNMNLMKALLAHKGGLNDQVLAQARRIIRQVVDELVQTLKQDIDNAFTGRLNRQRHSPLPVARNFDWHGTIRRNLKHWNQQQQQLVIEQLRFFSRVKRHLPWRVVLCVDQSASMTDSVIHAAVMAGILAALPAVRVKLVVFDTQVVDLSAHLEDPVETLMSVQLGGGTNIGQAMAYCQQLVVEPQRTIVVLISDFEEGGQPSKLLQVSKQLHEAGVTLLGLAALDQQANPVYDQGMAQRLSACGMDIAALTPKQFAGWLAQRIQ